MKKIILFATLTAALTASAEVLTPTQALMRLEQTEELQNAPAVRRMAANKLSSVMPLKTISDAAGVAQLYVFADEADGLMILSAESEAEPLIGYTDNYTPGDALPPALQYMLDCYAAEIDALRNGMVTFSATNSFNVDSPAIAPICTTKWNQGAPYNALCPTLNGSTSVTGCLATAMAQVLKTYEYPKQCSGGTYSYDWSNGGELLSLNFNEVTLDWDSMKDTYTSSESAPAVAELMRAVGYAANMNYSPSASGASSTILAQGLVRNFDYDCTLSHELREWYPLAEWQQKVYDVLAGGHAVYYDGTNPDNSAGHAFVVDGYSSDGLFHVNWGWGGMSDGYFRLTVLDPAAQGIGGSAAGYDRSQGAIFNLKPGATTETSDAPLVFFIQSDFLTKTTSAELGTSVTFRATDSNAGIYNNGPIKASKVSLGVKFTKSTGEVYWFHNSNIHSDINVYSGLYLRTSCTIDGLPEGDYVVSPAVYNPTSEKYYDVRYAVGQGATFNAKVEGTTITFSTPQVSIPTAQTFTSPETINRYTPFEITANFVNNYDEEYYGVVYAALLPVGSTDNATVIGTLMLTVPANGEQELSAYLEVETSSLASGEYDLALIDQNSYLISARNRVTLAEQVAQGTPKCTKIKVTDKHINNLTVSMTVTSQNGPYTNPVYAVFTEYGETAVVGYYPSQMVVIESGGTKTAEVVCNFVEGTPGNRYTVYPFYLLPDNYLSQMSGNSVSFTLAEEATAIEEVEAATEAVEYFDLNGRRVIDPANGIYIRKQGGKVTKVIL